ncbi:MAG: 2-oxoacid:acceptor oxidoreductase family protein [Lentisphaeria bacterium]|nr:2-oxoacid:acceptor oxidoreductase family protein [Lentisphaeria bacterium]
MSSERIIQAKGFHHDFHARGGSAPEATHYCAGCGHGVLHKLIAEALVDLNIQDQTIMVNPVGCAVFGYYYLDCGHVQAAHGRAPAVGAAIKRATPQAIVVSYQGDGDLASIGLNHTLQAANRGDHMVVFFVNNGIYGMTGGQMAPTTLAGQKTMTSPDGRDPLTDGYPIAVCELINQFKAPVYIERCSLSTAAKTRKARAAVRKALRIQKEGKGYAFVEFLSPCPTSMGNDAIANADFLGTAMEKEFPLGRFRDTSEEAVARSPRQRVFDKVFLDSLFPALSSAAAPRWKKSEPFHVKISGFGGQGVLSLGAMLAQAGQTAGLNVTWFPSYGPEQRGGTANCSVVLGKTDIGSPCVSSMDLLVAMNAPSIKRFAPEVRPGGTIFHEASSGDFSAPDDSIRIVPVPAFQLALDCGEERAANTAMLGAVAASGVTGLSPSDFENVLEHVFSRKKKVLAVNLKTFRHALDWAEKEFTNTRGGRPPLGT